MVKNKKKTESAITTELSKFLFGGAGEKYLGFRFADKELQEDGSWKTLPSRWDRKEKRWVYNYDHPEYWSVPQGNWYWKTSALNDHLRGNHRGLVVHEDTDATSVPFLAVDLDRHHKEDERKHIERVVRVGRLCQRLFPHLRWLAEVNLNNGSTKLFGFARKHLTINKAREMAKTLHTAVVQITGNKNTEVFCHNMPQILLPFRNDKCTIITGGELGKTHRYKIINNKREYFQAYSMCEFDAWFQGHGHYDEQTLTETLERACDYKVTSPIGDITITKPVSLAQRMMEEAYREAMGLDVPQPSLSSLRSDKDAPLGRGINGGFGPDGVLSPSASNNLDDIRSITNAFSRKREFSLWLARRLRRLPTVDEVLNAYKKNKLFNGSWEDKESKRRADFKSILPFIDKTFDPDKCGQNNSQRPELDEKIKMWQGRSTVQFVWKTNYTTIINQKKVVDEYGNVNCTAGKVRHVSGKKIHLVMAIIDQVRKPDGGIPRDSIQGWWQELAAEGKLPNWSIDTWVAYRQVLVQIGWITVNHGYSHRNHVAKTCVIVFGNGPLVGCVYTFPSDNNNNTTTSITVVTHSSPYFWGSDNDFIPRPPPREQPPPFRRFLPSLEEQISWN